MEGREENFQGEFKLPGELVLGGCQSPQSPQSEVKSVCLQLLGRAESSVATAQVDNGFQGGSLRSLSWLAWPGLGIKNFCHQHF